MKRDKKHNNFIIYMLLVVLLITGAGYGFGEEYQIFSSYSDVQNSEITVRIFKANNEIHSFQVKERNSVTLRYNSVKGNRAEVSLRGSLLFLCVLAILSVFSRLIQEVFVCFQRLFVHDRFYMITFMQDTDGRKRFS